MLLKLQTYNIQSGNLFRNNLLKKSLHFWTFKKHFGDFHETFRMKVSHPQGSTIIGDVIEDVPLPVGG